MGQSVHIEEPVTAFRDGGHEIIVVGPSFYEKADFGAESSVVHIVRRVLPGALSEIAELLYNIPAYLQVRRQVKRLSQISFTKDTIYTILVGMVLRNITKCLCILG